MKKIDSHVHFWNPNKLSYSWLKEVEELNRTFTIEDYQQASSQADIEKIVFVECNAIAEQNLAEVEWIESLAQEDARISAVVAYADLLDKDTIDNKLEALAQKELVRGIRHNIQGEAPGFCLQENYQSGIEKAHAKGFHIELCLTHDQLEDAIALVEIFPKVKFMLNHCAKPAVSANICPTWQKNIRALAEHKNTFCKLSGLLTEANQPNWQSKDILIHLQVCAEAFGNDRIIYGGDWPVLNLAGKYSDWQDITAELTRDWSLENREKFFHINAASFYRL